MTDTCMLGLHEAGHGGIPVWVPVTDKMGPSHRQKEGKSAGSRVWALLSHPCAPNPQMPGAAVSLSGCMCLCKYNIVRVKIIG